METMREPMQEQINWDALIQAEIIQSMSAAQTAIVVLPYIIIISAIVLLISSFGCIKFNKDEFNMNAKQGVSCVFATLSGLVLFVALLCCSSILSEARYTNEEWQAIIVERISKPSA